MESDKIAKLEEKLQQQKKKLQQREAYLRERKRKADIKRKIALGSLFYEVHMENIDEDILRGWLVFMEEKLDDPEFAKQCKSRGLENQEMPKDEEKS